MEFLLPGYGGQISGDTQRVYEQTAPLYNLYSPRLFGAPPQLTSLCDMRLQSSLGTFPGPVGDYYLQNILRSSQIANFVVGHATFTGGMSSIRAALTKAMQYTYALSKYNIYGGNQTNQTELRAKAMNLRQQQAELEAYYREIDEQTNGALKTESSVGTTGASDGSVEADTEQADESTNIINNIAGIFDKTGVLGTMGSLTAFFKAAVGMQQPFYTFEADWSTYINNVKMMINTAIVMLGLQDAVVRIGNDYKPIGVGYDDPDGGSRKENDTWANYRFITPTAGDNVGQVNAIDTMTGDTHQYVSFMINPASISENYTNTAQQSQIYSTVINSGSAFGNEIAFLTNTSKNQIDDTIVNLYGSAVDAAERIMNGLTGGIGKFTAAVMGAAGRSFTGDHTIFPEVYQSSSSTSTMTMKVQLRANAGDPYSYLIDILVPMFYIMGMALPKMSANAASAYAYPPLVQVNIPGLWGTRLGMVQQVQVSKNPEGNDFSINGYPLAVDLDVTIQDLQHVLMTSPMNESKMMLNNDTMFDYIAQCTGVDKFRINGAMRVVTKITLAASAGKDFLYNLGNAILNDGVSLVNRITGVSKL